VGAGAIASRVSRVGFTGHEDDLGLVNRRGHIYNPRLGRFLQTDPIVSAPASAQSWNPYSSLPRAAGGCGCRVAVTVEGVPLVAVLDRAVNRSGDDVTKICLTATEGRTHDMDMDTNSDPTLVAINSSLTDGMKIPIALVVGGTSITGLLIPAHEYYMDLPKKVGFTGDVHTAVDELHSAFHSDSDVPAGPAAAASHFHLIEATVEGAPVRLWRGRLDSVDAFALQLR
jgi:RHS repeat-associated protein